VLITAIVGVDYLLPIFVLFLLFYAGVNIRQVMVFVQEYSKWFSNENPSQDTNTHTDRTVYWGFGIGIAILSVVLGLFARDTVVASFGTERMATALYQFFGVTGIGGGVHLSTFGAFLVFLSFSKDEAALQQYKRIEIAEGSILNSRGIQELANMSVFTLIPIFGNALNLAFTRYHITGSVIEMIAYSLCWIILWRQNTKTACTRSCWTRNWVMFSAQFIVFVFLRLVVY
jgi:uncharacterized membrane protein YidH (DUF202 family)